MTVIYTQLLLMVIFCGKFFIKIFYGDLRPEEIDHVMSNSWSNILETCIVFAIFYPESNDIFLIRLGLLLCTKCIFSLTDARIDLMSAVIRFPKHFHIRMISVLSIFTISSVSYTVRLVNDVYENGLSIEMVFAFEYAILFITSLSLWANYVLNNIDLKKGSEWDNKILYCTYVDAIFEFFKIVIYTLFVLSLIAINHLPFFAIRPLTASIMKLKKSVENAIAANEAIDKLNKLLHPTEEELVECGTCAVCREEMGHQQMAKKLRCSHIFHFSCLRRWFLRQQRCPTCRSDVLN